MNKETEEKRKGPEDKRNERNQGRKEGHQI